jgi:hypothetical protein
MTAADTWKCVYCEDNYGPVEVAHDGIAFDISECAR